MSNLIAQCAASLEKQRDFMNNTSTTAEALEALVSTINNTGGVTRYPSGTLSPKGEPDWTDLGDAYWLACKALGREMVVEDAEPEDL